MAEREIGQVNDYFARAGVAGIDLTGELRVGDMIQIRGHTTDLTLTVQSMQIEHNSVERAEPGQSVGIKVTERCRKGDHVYKLTA